MVYFKMLVLCEVSFKLKNGEKIVCLSMYFYNIDTIKHYYTCVETEIYI